MRGGEGDSRRTEAERRAGLDAAMRPEGRLRLGAALQDIGQRHGITHVDIDAIERVRDRRPAEPMTFD
ncbi:MAG: plasmid stabilization protein [Tistrella sp.]|uniref:Plasmid stabilization protein n=1 Tax=Tistrella mobilis TaxID=171437 RepID=A0A3B9IKH8_9PROT|nr:plasmid stabilization protein [Tistrella sp.]MBA77070.1 plasmid stabilization protein [Tistrella sp.]HAE48361.1 plasmid stabilization protein [Tistrella mobilis]